MKHSLLKLTALCCALGYTACDSTGVGNPPRGPDPVLDTNEDALVADGDEGTRAGLGAASLIAIPWLMVNELKDIATSETAAAKGALAANFQFLPGGCATTARAANVVTWTFVDCAGKVGVSGLSGKLTTTYTATAEGLDITYQSDGLTMEKLDGLNVVTAAIDLKASAHLTFVSGARKVVWNGNYVVTLVGKRITHEARYEMTVESECLNLAGGAKTTLLDTRGTRTVQSTWEGYRRCGDKRTCPEPGGVLTIVQEPSGFTVRIRLLGGQSIEVTSTTRPKPVIVDKLQCIP